MIEDERRLPTCSTGVCALRKYGAAAPLLASAVAEERSVKGGTPLIGGRTARSSITGWMRGVSGPVSLVFHDDEGGSAVANFRSDDTGLPAAKRLSVRPGLTRFVWDLKYSGPEPLDTTLAPPLNKPLAEPADPTAGPAVVPGRYRVEISLGSETMAAEFSVVGGSAPRHHAGGLPSAVRARSAIDHLARQAQRDGQSHPPAEASALGPGWRTGRRRDRCDPGRRRVRIPTTSRIQLFERSALADGPVLAAPPIEVLNRSQLRLLLELRPISASIKARQL
jgi:hypothetical protein